MSATAERRMIVKLLAEGNPIWYVAALVNKSSHEVYEIGRSAGYPDQVKLRRAAWRERQSAVA